MKTEWIEYCIDLSLMPADFFVSGRKILRNRSLTFAEMTGDMTMKDIGFTKSKSSMLNRLYKHQESIDVAKILWEKRKKVGSYGSVGFTCYNHFVKSANDPGRTRAFGPCIQSVVITQMPKGSCEVDIFYRTTEFFKKFPADLVFIYNDLLSQFDINPRSVNFHFANITMHPMYFGNVLPMVDDPIGLLEKLNEADPYFHDWAVKWTARYLIPEYHRGIAKFQQALRTGRSISERIGDDIRNDLVLYLRDNHPGHRNEYNDT